LIVTYTDHTAHACPSVRNEPKSKSFPYSDLQLYPLSPEQAEQLTDDQKLAGTLFGVTVIQGLLEYSDTYKRYLRGKPNLISPWPLIPSQVSGLHAALFHLQQYIGTLRPEQGG
jgi:hypothetical protein